MPYPTIWSSVSPEVGNKIKVAFKVQSSGINIGKPTFWHVWHGLSTTTMPRPTLGTLTVISPGKIIQQIITKDHLLCFGSTDGTLVVQLNWGIVSGKSVIHAVGRGGVHGYAIVEFT